MKALTCLRLAGYLIALFALTVLLIGCSTTKKVDWNSRVGSYTYDQAMVEYGPPDKQAKLSDGRTVAEWITRRPAARVEHGLERCWRYEPASASP
jgi:hypothetical protein